MIDAHHTQPGKGLPIGALTSQHFANYYLMPVDRFILEGVRARAMVRYMDDMVWWCDSREQAKESLARVEAFIAHALCLRLKTPSVIQRSETGLGLCGFRIRRGQLRLSRRRQRRYVSARSRWEGAYESGLIDERALQRGYDGVLATTSHADARTWRRAQMERTPGLEEA